MEGGLNFKSISTQNVAMGAKLLWRIIAPNPGWAQLALWKKYFRGQRKRCLDNPISNSGSVIHKLCAKATSLINLHVHWIPSNGKHIRIWEDRIMDSDPLVDDWSLFVLRDWMTRAGFVTLWDIYQWEDDVWQSWVKLEVPQNLNNECAIFLAHLKGKAPINSRKPDTRGWGSTPGRYTVSQGYIQLLIHPHVPPDPEP